MNSRSKLSAFFLVLALAACSSACHQTTVLATDSEIPTATVKEVDLQLKVITTGVLRTSQSRTIIAPPIAGGALQIIDRKSTRLNSSHSQISYAVFCLKKKNAADEVRVATGVCRIDGDAGDAAGQVGVELALRRRAGDDGVGAVRLPVGEALSLAIVD